MLRTSTIASLKWLVAIALLVIVLRLTGAREIWGTLHHISAGWFAVLIGTTLALLAVSALKWARCTAAVGAPQPPAELAALLLAGYAVNIAVPSFLGGDILRAWMLTRRSGAGSAIVATALDRYLTLLAIAVLALGCLPYAAGVTPEVRAAVAVMAAAVLAGGCAACVIKPAGSGRLAQVREALIAARRRPVYLMQALLLAFLYQGAMVLNVYTAATAVGWQPNSILALFVTLPVMYTLSSIPLAPASLGIQEAVFLYFLEAAGAAGSQALAVDVIMRAKSLALALAGILVLNSRWSTSEFLRRSRPE